MSAIEISFDVVAVRTIITMLRLSAGLPLAFRPCMSSVVASQFIAPPLDKPFAIRYAPRPGTNPVQSKGRKKNCLLFVSFLACWTHQMIRQPGSNFGKHAQDHDLQHHAK